MLKPEKFDVETIEPSGITAHVRSQSSMDSLMVGCWA